LCTRTSLAYYATEKSKSPLRVIDLRKCTAALETSFEKGVFGIEIVLPERTFLAFADSKEDRADWIKTLRQIIARSF